MPVSFKEEMNNNFHQNHHPSPAQLINFAKIDEGKEKCVKEKYDKDKKTYDDIDAGEDGGTRGNPDVESDDNSSDDGFMGIFRRMFSWPLGGGNGGGEAENDRRRRTSEVQAYTNQYSVKKTAAQGALTTAQFAMNSSQLKAVIDKGECKYFHALIILISLSMLLQIASGILLAFVGSHETKPIGMLDETRVRATQVDNRRVVIMVFLVSALNIVISTFYMSI